jgi:hypothetical protein
MVFEARRAGHEKKVLSTITEWTLNDKKFGPPVEIVRDHSGLRRGQFRRATNRLDAKGAVEITEHEGEDFWGSTITQRIRIVSAESSPQNPR